MFFFSFGDEYISGLSEAQAIEFELATLEVFGWEAVVDWFPVDDDYVVEVSMSELSSSDLEYDYGDAAFAYGWDE